MRKIRDFEAYIDDYKLVIVYIKRSYFQGNSDFFYLSDSKSEHYHCVINAREMSTGDYTKYYLTTNKALVIGEKYEIVDSHANRHYVEYGTVVKTAIFDEQFAYSGDDLGAIYSKKETTFTVWAPVAFAINVVINRAGKTKDVPLKRSDFGVFRGVVKGNLSGIKYKYLVYVNGGWQETIDPYAHSLSANGQWGVIIDLSKTQMDMASIKEEINNVQQIIYEISVRDMTSSLTANVKSPMTYSGLSEVGTKYKGYPTAIDHIASLGVTMVQVMPVFDFASVDELDVRRFYNWGYDPSHYKALEGGFSSNPEDGYARVLEFKKMVASFHRKGIRVCLDLVYNHVYDMEANSLWRLVPNYFFRMSNNGAISNGSFCGNDYESQTVMGRKYLVDCCVGWVKEYDIDAFRFDLMAITDIDTMNMIVKEVRKIKPNFMIYGEGWDMPTMLPLEKKSTIGNNLQIPDVGFFSDRFRDVVKGSTSIGEENLRGYCSNDVNLIEMMKNVLTGGTIPYGAFAYVSDPNQMINYVSCHDNQTLWDKLKNCCKDETREQRIARQKLIIGCLLIAQGVPFLNSGQEFCRTKAMEHNSYRSNDEINQIDYQRMIAYREVVDYTIAVVNLRKSKKAFTLATKIAIEEQVSFINLPNGALLYRIDQKDGLTIDCFINPTHLLINYEYPKSVNILMNEKGYLYGTNHEKIVAINPISLVIVEYGKV